MLERLQKIIAEAGICSRREAEKLIKSGKVFVNEKKVTLLGSKADPYMDKIRVGKRKIKPIEKKLYYLFNKPRNVMTTRFDPEGRKTIFDYLVSIKDRVYPVGRLDFDSEGLLLLTNDGELTHRLTHPSSEILKTYEVRVQGLLTEEHVKKLEQGIEIDTGKTMPTTVKLFKQTDKNCWIQITLHEGKNRQIRKMIETLGFSVLKLRRTAIGPLKLNQLRPGTWREIPPSKMPNF